MTDYRAKVRRLAEELDVPVDFEDGFVIVAGRVYPTAEKAADVLRRLKSYRWASTSQWKHPA